MKSTKKNRKITKVSYRPKNVIPETNGNKKISSISYSKKNIQISKNCIGNRIVF